jgi:rfaE bifunctional protein kinase chain/domain
VAVNLVAMGAEASIVAIVGDDPPGVRLRQELETQGVYHEGVVTHPNRPTTVKTRVMAHSQQILRVDREDRSPIAAEVADQLVERARKQLRDVDGVLFSDYSKGVLSERVVAGISGLARDAGLPAFANAKPVGLHQYQALTFVQLNQPETESVTGLCLSDLESVGTAGERLLERCGLEAAIITLGGRGLGVFERGRPWRHLPVVCAEVYDACGCGDTTIAAAALARIAGADWLEAATVANLAGNAKVRKLGVVPVTRLEIEHVWELGDAPGTP